MGYGTSMLLSGTLSRTLKSLVLNVNSTSPVSRSIWVDVIIRPSISGGVDWHDEPPSLMMTDDGVRSTTLEHALADLLLAEYEMAVLRSLEDLCEKPSLRRKSWPNFSEYFLHTF